MTIKKKLSAPAKKVKGKPKTIEPTLRAPRWSYWIAKDAITLEQATALSLGLEPVRGLVGLLRPMKRRMLDYRRRQEALNEDYGRNPWLPPGKSLPKLYRVRGVLEYAREQKWDLKKNVALALERVRHSGTESELDMRGAESPAGAARPPSVGTIEISVPDALGAVPLAATSSSAPEIGKRAELNLQRTFGALVLLVEKLVLKRDIKAYLRGSSFNTAALARSLVDIISDEELAPIPVTGLGQRAIEMRISDALKLFPMKAKSFAIDEGEPQTPTTPRREPEDHKGAA